MPFSNDVELLRKKLFLSQEDFAKEIGVSFATVNRWESGKVSPNNSDYLQKARKYGHFTGYKN